MGWNPRLTKAIVLKEVSLKGDVWGFASYRKWIPGGIHEVLAHQVHSPGEGQGGGIEILTFFNTWE